MASAMREREIRPIGMRALRDLLRAGAARASEGSG
jgi:hypothetical protein